MSGKSINKLLSKFDLILEDISKELSVKVTDDFERTANQITFRLDDGMEKIQKETNKLPSNPGLYLFEVNLQSFYNGQINSIGDCSHPEKSTNYKKRKHFFECLNMLWTEPEERIYSSYPKIIKKRLLHHFCLRPYKNNFEDKEWIPLYLGINKNIQERVLQHIKCDSSTFSMKLSHLSETVFNEYPIRVSTSVIPGIELNRRYMLVKEIENILRERLHPIVGKQ